jgi:hypothetical protein
MKTGTQLSMDQILNIASDKRIPAISISINDNPLLKINDGYYSSKNLPENFFKISKHREFMLKYYVDWTK